MVADLILDGDLEVLKELEELIGEKIPVKKEFLESKNIEVGNLRLLF
jgi:hypothetical protein